MIIQTRGNAAGFGCKDAEGKYTGDKEIKVIAVGWNHCHYTIVMGPVINLSGPTLLF